MQEHSWSVKCKYESIGVKEQEVHPRPGKEGDMMAIKMCSHFGQMQKFESNDAVSQSSIIGQTPCSSYILCHVCHEQKFMFTDMTIPLLCFP